MKTRAPLQKKTAAPVSAAAAPSHRFQPRPFVKPKVIKEEIPDCQTQPLDLSSLTPPIDIPLYSPEQMAAFGLQAQTEPAPTLEQDKTQEDAPPVQAKLTIGQPGDKYEQEADATAAKIMRMADPVASQGLQHQAEPEKEELPENPLAPPSSQANPAAPSLPPQGQPKQAATLALKPSPQPASLTEDEAQPEDEAPEEYTLSTKPPIQAKGAAPAVPNNFESQLSQNRGSGRPLPDQTRAFMEPRFGADFSNVRIHETPDLASAIQAQAFTHGQDIYFNSGKYNPGSSGGKELLAHELTHVVQQNGAAIQPHTQPPENATVRAKEETPAISSRSYTGHLQAQANQSASQSASEEGSSPIQYVVDPKTPQRYIVEYRVKKGSQDGTFVFVDTYGSNRNQLYLNSVYSLADYRYPVDRPNSFRYVRRASSGKIEQFQSGDSFRLYIGDELISTVSTPASETDEQDWWLGESWEWVWEVLKGDFHEDPETGQVVVRTLITLIPVVDQIADLQDLVAALHKLAWQKRVNEFGPWFDLFTTAIGLIPTVGSAVKGIAKLLLKAADKVEIGALKKLLNAVAGKLDDFSVYAEQAVEAIKKPLNDLAGQARETAKKLRAIPEWGIRIIPGVSVKKFRQFTDKLDEFSRSIEDILAQVDDKFREIGERIQRQLDQVLGGKGELVTPEGVRVRPGKEPDRLTPSSTTTSPSNATTTSSKKRPTWRQSEDDVGEALGNDYRPQVSFKNGEEVPYGTKGSIRVDYYTSGTSIEVKNYNVETPQGRNNLIRNISRQAKERQQHLPPGTTQRIKLDVRGQNITRKELNDLLDRIMKSSNGAIEIKAEDVLR